MPNLKDTDFDDLFRRASDKYPLRTDSANWDRMAASLEKDPSPDTYDEDDDTDRRRRRRFFWWFLLLPLAGIGYYVVHPSGLRGKAPATGIAVTRPATSGAAEEKNGSTANNAPANSAAGNNAVTDNATANSAAAKNAATANPTANPTADPTANPTANNAANTTSAPNHAADRGAAKTVALSADQTGAGIPRKGPGMVNFTNPKSTSKVIRSAGRDVSVLPEGETKESNKEETKETNRSETVAAAFSLHNASVNEQRARIADPYALNVKVNAPAVKKDSTKPKAKRQSYLYAGILGGADLSTVRFQRTKGVGTTFGVLVGFAFNSHWAVETGAYVDRKRYYTDGEYFNTKNIYMPPNTYLQNADGTCYMWEIPLNVRYTFNPQGKTRWFATAGLSTYLMNREKYTGALENYSGTWSYSHTWNLHKSSQYPFSIVGFSAGLEQRLGNVGNLRIEPYVRVPLSGIGTGSLPILSTGINIGITRRLWK